LRRPWLAAWGGLLLAGVLAGGWGRIWGADLPASPAAPAEGGRPLAAARLELAPGSALLTSQFAPGTEPQTMMFNRVVSGRYFCLETLSAWDGRAYAAVAELELLDVAGQPLSREGWRIAYADSEEYEHEDGSAANAIDGDRTTFWHTQWSSGSPNHPHHLVVDLGKSRTLAGFRYFPRPGANTVGGRIKDYRVYVGNDLLRAGVLGQPLPEKCYLFAYFTDESKSGLQLAYSLNGYRWDSLSRGHGVIKPEVGGKLMRDPCLLAAPDGTFHMVWTAGWTGNYIGYASSKDLVHWSEQRAIPVMSNAPATLNCWAPEIFWDARRTNFLIFWASTMTNQLGSALLATNNRIYCTTTRDFQTFSETRLFFDPGYSVLDATMLAEKGRFYLIFKDDQVNHLRVAVAEDPAGPFGRVSAPLEPGNVEGPMTFRFGGQIAVCFHQISEARCGAVRTPDLEHWEDISAGMFFPPGSQQGTLLELSGEQLKPLWEAGLFQAGPTPAAVELGLGDWIWTTNVTDRQSCRLWQAFDIPPNVPIVRAVLRMTADNSYTAYLDGTEIGRGGDANSLAEYDLTWLLSAGRHVLAVEAFNDTFDAGMILGLRVELAGGKNVEVMSGPAWRIVTDAGGGWLTRKQADPAWPRARVVGYAGQAWWQQPNKIIQVPPLRLPVVRFWQQGWVLVLLLLACATVLVLWVRQGVRLAWQTRAHRLLDRERARIARDMHDDLGSGLTQLTLLGELVLRDTAPGGDSQGRLNELCAKARSLLRSMDEIVWAVNPRRDTVKDCGAFIAEHAQEFLAAAAIRCRQDVAEELPAFPLGLPQRRNLLLAVKEAIRNAARHSGANEVHLEVRVVDDCFKVVVADNGKGFDPAAADGGRNGLANMKQRLADIGGSLVLDTAPGAGCRITFLLPLGRHDTLSGITL
jgi:signal transduction histidine kinase